MPFDRMSSQPLVNPGRRATKVNLSIVVAVVIFFIATGFVTWRIWLKPPQHTGSGHVIGH